MSSIRVEGGKKLQGRIRISGSKNSCLALMAGAALGREDVVLTKVPENTDVQIMTALLREIGVQVEEKTPGVMVVNGAKLRNTLIPHELARKLRASVRIVPGPSGESPSSATGWMLPRTTAG